MALTDLQGRTAMVTGGARGIGLALAHALLDEGMTVIVTDQDEDVLHEAVAGLATDRARAHVLDVRDPHAWERIVQETWAQHGGIDLLCNNAGIGVSAPAGMTPYRAWEVPFDSFQRVLEVNLLGILIGLRTVLPRMIARGAPGHVVNTASMAGFLAPPHLGAYATSKFAVVALSEVVAAELVDEQVGISILCPGGVATPFNESARRFGAQDQKLARADAPASADEMKMDPTAVAKRVVAAVRTGELFVFTHPEYEALVRERHEHVLGSFREPAQRGYCEPEDLLARSRSPLHRPHLANE